MKRQYYISKLQVKHPEMKINQNGDLLMKTCGHHVLPVVKNVICFEWDLSPG